ncbi:hypothetical protein [Leifsonia xyli]|uniref:hypothetical protein n=1 Tax=Leifsonia xyli TaxID=1575 RepID=UPI003D676A59
MTRTSVDDAPPAKVRSAGARLRAALVRHATGELAIYGTVLVAGLVVIERRYVADAAPLALAVAQGVAVIWAAHVFAATVAHSALGDRHREPVRAALAHALQASSGLILAALAPLALLGLGAMGVVAAADALLAALGSSALALAALGYVALARAGARVRVRIGGALLIAAVGLTLVVLKAVVH